jgi:hypothetical protein
MRNNRKENNKYRIIFFLDLWSILSEDIFDFGDIVVEGTESDVDAEMELLGVAGGYDATVEFLLGGF